MATCGLVIAVAWLFWLESSKEAEFEFPLNVFVLFLNFCLSKKRRIWEKYPEKSQFYYKLTLILFLNITMRIIHDRKFKEDMLLFFVSVCINSSFIKHCTQSINFVCDMSIIVLINAQRRYHMIEMKIGIKCYIFNQPEIVTAVFHKQGSYSFLNVCRHLNHRVSMFPSFSAEESQNYNSVTSHEPHRK